MHASSAEDWIYADAHVSCIVLKTVVGLAACLCLVVCLFRQPSSMLFVPLLFHMSALEKPVYAFLVQLNECNDAANMHSMLLCVLLS